MPIKPENARLYPKDWKAISLEVREAAFWQCEGAPGIYENCMAIHEEPHPITGSIVVLTVAHLDHDPTNCGEPGNRPNLRALCQRCHLTYDAKHHARSAATTRRAKLNNADLFEETPTNG